MKGLALATVGLWVILQTTYGPLATKIGLITGGTSSSPEPAAPGGNPGGGSDPGANLGKEGTTVPNPLGGSYLGGAR